MFSKNKSESETNFLLMQEWLKPVSKNGFVKLVEVQE